MDFDEMNKRLGDATQKDSRINQLAAELFKRGLTMTMDPAKQMATSMVETELRVQKRFQDRMHPMSAPSSSSVPSRPSAPAAPASPARPPSYSEVARDSVAKRTFNPEPIIQPRPREEAPRPLPRTEILGLDAKRSLKELQEEYERQHGAVPANALKENIDALREKALRHEPVAIQTSFDTPASGAATPKMVQPELSEEDFIEVLPEHFPQVPAAVTTITQVEPAPEVEVVHTDLPSPSPAVALPVLPSEDDDFPVLTPESGPSESRSSFEPVTIVADGLSDVTAAPVSDDVDDGGFLPVSEVSASNVDSAPEAASFDTPVAPVVPAVAEPAAVEPAAVEPAVESAPPASVEEAPAKPKRDMAKEHGIDINAIFRFGK